MQRGEKIWEVIVVGAGFAGLSAAIYLGRARRQALVVDAGASLALWEPNVQNYLGFPDGISGEELLRRGLIQAKHYGAELTPDLISRTTRDEDLFYLEGERSSYRSRRLLLSTGLYHIPPDIPGVDECLGHSLFFCKDCDGYRVKDRRIAVIGHNNEAVEYSLGLLLYSPSVVIATNGKKETWDAQHEEWISEYEIPVRTSHIAEVCHKDGQLFSLTLESGECISVDCAFTTRGDIYHNHLAVQLGAELDAEGQVKTDEDQRTTVPGLYAAGCLTPANCQMIIAAGQGATAAQAINRDLFEESLRTHSLRQHRESQLAAKQTKPECAPAKTEA